MRKESWQFSKHFSFFFFFSSFHLSGYLCVLNKAVMGFLFFFSPFFFLGVSVISAAASVYPYGICLHGCHIKKQSVFYSLPIITLSLKDTGILLSASWAGNRSQTTLREIFLKIWPWLTRCAVNSDFAFLPTVNWQLGPTWKRVILLKQQKTHKNWMRYGY